MDNVKRDAVFVSSVARRWRPSERRAASWGDCKTMDIMNDFDKRTNYYGYRKPSRLRGPLEAKLFALRRGNDSKIGRHVTEPMLARLLGCTVAHYQRMERGRHPFRDEHLHKLADYYGVDFDELKRLRAVEQLLFQAGFPDSDPRPVLWSALDYAEKLALFFS